MIELVRVSYTKQGTFGVLLREGIPLCVTLEDPEKNNQKGVSCIPTGTYLVGPHNGTNFRDVWILKDVPNREAILIHNGNTIEDTRGCILVGQNFGTVNDLPGVGESKLAVEKLRKILPKSFALTIKSL